MKKISHTEYPRPQLERDSYINLNGEWDLTHIKSDYKSQIDYKINVPFSPESIASGIGSFILQPNEELVYKKEFEIPSDFVQDITLLHFGAVDYSCICFINGKEVGSHKGGFLPFQFDISNWIQIGKNEIQLMVKDPTDFGPQSRGKQKLKRGGIWYTPQSGIWQTVWLESVSKDYIKDIKITPNIDTKTVEIIVTTDNNDVKIQIIDGNQVIGESPLKTANIEIPNMELWSPENPKLYEVLIKSSTDTVKSYFGMRKFSIGFDGKFKRLFLNNKPYFHNGLLDQGYWSEGLLTPPNDEAMEKEIKLMKEMGFNMLRKHIKIEPLRWYYHCDRLGVLVWQDFVCGGGAYETWKVAYLPFIGWKTKDTKYKFLNRTDEAGRKEFISEIDQTVHLLKNTVSLSVWVLFNEGWGQFDSIQLTEKLKKLDDTRTIDSVSGWYDQGQESSDLKSLHLYYQKLKVPKKEKRVIVLSEFGGYSLKTEGHVFDENKLFGYKILPDKQSLELEYKKLIESELIPLIDQGLSASIYTQVSDVEEEINGIVTYDRKVIKFDIEFMKNLNAKLVYK
ncbi:glycoside hydrolase family 2 [Leptospira bourretii]|uniref:Glycoside hydrolase family 2 n=2 Tax=Leptospira bourretii TaxID=2484962 RepID=A0A4R9IJ46_9LEPT|nr:sugar-binding domain-containing protein [Leptospira bourretii]TGK88025.1 glycoside hydrolase family 2 [Leptospira bourretii]TGK88675.1 glycoside hydrolase family 2 [Leptospira bourretii]TGL20488.1 glycoside hydrolase family 2 [Leptospira bourretii]